MATNGISAIIPTDYTQSTINGYATNYGSMGAVDFDFSEISDAALNYVDSSSDLSSIYSNYNLGGTSSYYGYGAYPTRDQGESDESYTARVNDYVSSQSKVNTGLTLQNIDNNTTISIANAQAQNTVSSSVNAINVKNDSLTNQIQQLANIIGEGKTDNAKEKLNDIISTYRQNSAYANLSDQEIITMIEKTYPGLESDIEANCSGGFMNGFINTLTFGLAGESTTKDELLSQIRDTECDTSAKAAEVTGSAAAGAAYGAGIGLAVTLGNPVGAAIGAGIGAVAGLIKGIIV